MRWNGLFAALFLVGVPSRAQIPERKELTATPKFVEDAPKPAFKRYTEAQLKAEIRILSARSYAMFGYNTPEVRIKLPQVANSSYSVIEFGPATLLDAKGKEVPFELEEGGYQENKFSDEIRFRVADSDQLVRFDHVRGHVKVKYPLAVTTTAATKAKPGPPALAVKIDGPYVSFAEEEAKLPDTSFTRLKPLRAYDAAGHQLEQHGYSEATYDDSGAYVRRTSFYGVVARVELDSVEDWAELDLAYDLKPAPMLPAGKEGEAPEGERP
ncbi:MAG TPA: hypothetical protein VJ600_03285 [Holophagaceae bacterium]|nr:hypothetical protein [Holophagaceae bacterium]